MGMLVDGLWIKSPPATDPKHTSLVRPIALFKNIISTDSISFPVESGRYHLYASYACPWAHLTLIFRQLKGLSPHISMSVLHPHMLSRGWEFIPIHPLFRDPINYCRCLYELYLLSNPFYSGAASLPVLWDKKSRTIVNNDPHDIARMFNDAFNTLTGNTLDYYPNTLQSELDTLAHDLHEKVNWGVYTCGTATKQHAYETAFDTLFATLDMLEQRLSQSAYLIQNTLTAVDWQLFVTLIRFDYVYYSLFKCNLQPIAQYKNLAASVARLYHTDSIAHTVNFEHIKQHYYYSYTSLNPTQIVPKGPLLKI